MDLGKMLDEAIVATHGGKAYIGEATGACVVLDGEFDLNAVAEAFLGKVREAQGIDVEVVMGHDQDGALVPMKRPLSSKAGNEALAFYADPKNWISTRWQSDMDPSTCARDAGTKAREALVVRPYVGDHTGLVPFVGGVMSTPVTEE